MDRIASKLNVQGHIYPVHTLLFTLPGIPSIYYGSEFGVQGRKEGGNDAPLRPKIDLQEIKEDMPDKKLYEWICTLGKIHKQQKALSEGTYQELLLTNRQYAFARIMGEEGVLVAVNNDEQEAELCVRVPASGKMYTSLLSGEEIREENGMLRIRLKPNESEIAAFK